MRGRSWWPAAVVTLIVACGGPDTRDRPPPGDVPLALLAADNRRDLDSVVALYADSARLLPPGEPPVVGREAIRDRYRGIFASTGLVLRGEVRRVRETDALAVVEGTVEGEVTDSNTGVTTRVNDVFVMILIWDVAGRWRIATLIWSPTG